MTTEMSGLPSVAACCIANSLNHSDSTAWQRRLAELCTAKRLCRRVGFHAPLIGADFPGPASHVSEESQRAARDLVPIQCGQIRLGPLRMRRPTERRGKVIRLQIAGI